MGLITFQGLKSSYYPPIPKRPAKAGVKGKRVAIIKNKAKRPKAARASSGSVISFKLGRSKSRCKNKITIAQYIARGFAKDAIPKTIKVAIVTLPAVLRPSVRGAFPVAEGED